MRIGFLFIFKHFCQRSYSNKRINSCVCVLTKIILYQLHRKKSDWLLCGDILKFSNWLRNSCWLQDFNLLLPAAFIFFCSGYYLKSTTIAQLLKNQINFIFIYRNKIKVFISITMQTANFIFNINKTFLVTKPLWFKLIVCPSVRKGMVF